MVALLMWVSWTTGAVGIGLVWNGEWWGAPLIAAGWGLWTLAERFTPV